MSDAVTKIMGLMQHPSIDINALEVAFDAAQLSRRHKSGVALRFPRIHRIRWDKPAAEADTLESILALIGQVRRADA